MLMLAIMVGVPVFLALWLAIFLKWQRGFWMLLVFLPFAGAVTLFLRPNPAGPLLKDFLFVIPLYVVFFMLHTDELRRVRIPGALTLLLIVFAGLVLLQLFNPNIKRFAIGLVGAKVWLMYLPLIYVSAAFFRKPEDLIKVLRVAVALAVIPSVLGLVQFMMCASIGYKTTMAIFYGANAADVTQNFASFFMGAEFYRIPSTFSYVTQYSGYCLMMIPVVYLLQSVESDVRWRNFARIMMAVVFAASMLSGARTNFLFAPLLYMTILFLDAKLTRMAAGLVFGPIVMVSTLQAAGLDALGIFGATGGLATTYGRDLVLAELIQSIAQNPFGRGVGMNTGPALNLMSEAEKAATHNVEGYYSKAVIELGFIGMMLVIMIFAALILYGLQLRQRLRDPMARSAASAIVAFIMIMALHSGKGWQIDLDPINVWFWVLVGILFRLPYLDFSEVARARRLAEAGRPPAASRRRQSRSVKRAISRWRAARRNSQWSAAAPLPAALSAPSPASRAPGLCRGAAAWDRPSAGP